MVCSGVYVVNSRIPDPWLGPWMAAKPFKVSPSSLFSGVLLDPKKLKCKQFAPFLNPILFIPSNLTYSKDQARSFHLLVLVPFRQYLSYNIHNMQRAFASRAATSVRSASKLRPLTAAGFNAQQLRFAHKVCHPRIQFRILRLISMNVLLMRLILVGAQVWC